MNARELRAEVERLNEDLDAARQQVLAAHARNLQLSQHVNWLTGQVSTARRERDEARVRAIRHAHLIELAQHAYATASTGHPSALAALAELARATKAVS